MKLAQAALALSLLFLLSAQAQAQQTGSNHSSPTSLPIWAYPVEPAGALPLASDRAADAVIQHVPHSTASYTEAQIADLFEVPDWFPHSHPPMPRVVAKGRRPVLFACAYCHLPNGLGRPENQSVAGLPKKYIEQQITQFRNGNRRSSQPRMASVNHMIGVARAATPEEIEAAADYFSSLKLRPWIRVIETAYAPKTEIAGGMLVVVKGEREPIGDRVIEVPENLKLTELRDPNSGFIAYVPPGTLARGKDLVMTGAPGKTVPCTSCHGPDLRGMGDVPSIAGRSPSQMTRQILDIQSGARGGPAVLPMQVPVAKLTISDIVSITGYLASLTP